MSSSVSLEYINSILGTGTNGLSTDGGYYITLKNNTGAPSVKGTVVAASTEQDKAVQLAGIGAVNPIGVILDSGVAVGQPVRVVVSGMAQVLLASGQAATRGYWCEVSDVQAGRMMQLEAPNPLTHWNEIGHCIESKTAGNTVLALVVLHFN